ncbi:IS3 family transposase [Chryseobacterium gotjawalense]|uniref:IS3 family transposase n=1 Tax=Chryseobacterium gotjawalense TaxID=3042315 RepID=UPI00294FFC18|nr:IS3 family transposase [Chryseobacterium sp. wdc7]
MNALYRAVGISRQAVQQYEYRQNIFDENVRALMLEAHELRNEHPGCGVEKMYYALKPEFMGRDRFIELFMELGFRLEHKRNYRKTTHSVASEYPNLIKGMEVNAPNTIWQSDITYIYVNDRFYYAVFIIDVYTKKITGYKISNNMRATANVEALKMAVRDHCFPKIHHSDRGGQYIYKEYVKLLKEGSTQISMALSAQDNAYAERINKTIKEEYLDRWKPMNFEQLKKFTKRAVDQYNNRRPHNNLGRLSPVEFERRWQEKGFSSQPIITINDNNEP